MRLCIFFSSTHLVSSCLNRAFIWASECTGSPYWLFIITLTFGLWVNLLNRVSLGNNLSKDSAKTMRSQIKTFKAWSPLNKQCENSITLFFCRSLQNSIRCYKRFYSDRFCGHINCQLISTLDHAEGVKTL